MFKTIFLSFCIIGTAAAAPELVEIGDAGNPGQSIPFGELKKAYPRGTVNYPYRIGKTEVTNWEYATFLNAVAKSDPHGLYNDRMKIVRSGKDGDFTYTPQPETADAPVNYVTRIAAARYCNWLSGAEVYRIERKKRENGTEVEAIVGRRNLTDPAAPRLYYLPDIHEFHKAAFYDGKGHYPEVTPESRSKASHYGLLNYASGTREWVENKYHAGATILLGATEQSKDRDEINGVIHRQMAETAGDESTGFRIAATAPLTFAPDLNRRNNFFTAEDQSARLRIRYDGTAPRKLELTLTFNDYTGKTVSSGKRALSLKNGVNDLPVEIPARDGYYELAVTPHDPSFNGQNLVIPLMVMRTPMPDWRRDGNFGFTVHVTRWEKRFTFEDVDFDLLRQLGAGIIRVDVQFHDIAGSQTALKRIYDRGFRPLGIISSGDINNYSRLEQNRKENPGLVAKWARYGIPPFAAWYAENVYNLVGRNKEWTKDWELGNEPTYWKILAEDYGQLAKAGFIAAKLADPNCNVMLGDVNAIHVPVFSVRAGDFCDSIASHIYGFYVPSFWGIIGKMRELNGWKAAVGIAAKPVWLTEIGVCTYSHMHTLPVRSLDEVRRYQGLHVPKSMAGSLAFGAAKVLNYNYRDVPVDSLEEEFGMIDRYGYPKPGAMSYRTTARMLGNARFSGFVKGHSGAPGGIAGLAFKNASGEDILVFWRNDVYGESSFAVPFNQLIKPPETVKVKASAAELITLDGAAEKLSVADGAVKIPVNEYPVFVRGKLSPEMATIATRHERSAVTFKDAKVKILPPRDNKIKACDLMSGVFLDLTVGRKVPVTVHVYNLQHRELTGTLRLIPPSSWRSWDWPVVPSESKLTIPADGMGSTEFSIPVPQGLSLDKAYYLEAVFETAAGVEYHDKVQCRTVSPQIDPARWITYSKGYNIEGNKDLTELRLSWSQQHQPYGTCYLRKPEVLAANTTELQRLIVLPCRAGKAPLKYVSLLAMDKNNEYFQLKRPFRSSGNDWEEIVFDTADFQRPGKFIAYGGDKNAKLDFPVRLLGFNFDLDRADKTAGSLAIRQFEDREK